MAGLQQEGLQSNVSEREGGKRRERGREGGMEGGREGRREGGKRAFKAVFGLSDIDSAICARSVPFQFSHLGAHTH